MNEMEVDVAIGELIEDVEKGLDNFGTIFLDEISNISINSQKKLLALCEVIYRVYSGDKKLKNGPQIISSTSYNLKEKIRLTTLIAIIIAAAGIIFMSFDSKGDGTLFGLFNGLLSSLGFAGFTVSLRWRKQTPKFTTVSIAGIFCALVAVIVLIFYDSNILISVKNSSLSAATTQNCHSL